MQRIVHIASNPGDVVLDCFAGSGTTAAVAHKMGRRWIAVEQSRDTVSDVRAAAAREGGRGRRPGRDHEGHGLGGRRRVPRARGGTVDVRRGRRARVARRVGRGRLARRGDRGAARLRLRAGAAVRGPQGRTRLAVVDGLVNPDVARLLVGALAPEEKLVLCGTAIDPDVTQALRELRPGSRARKIPASILAEYRIGLEWR